MPARRRHRTPKPQPPEPPEPELSVVEDDSLWVTWCFTCHGPDDMREHANVGCISRLTSGR